MKKAFLLLAFVCSLQVTEAGNPVSILSVSSSIIYFKVDKIFIGAELEIEDERGNLVATEIILHKKVIVDFYFKTAGKYRIRIKKGTFEETFMYENLAFESTVRETKQDEILISQ
jgi:hypothetical protein